MHYTDRPEWAAFLQSILENPADDTVRLVLCDWLEELGEEEAGLKAEFIRVQVELEPVRYVTIGNQIFDQHRLQDREADLWAKSGPAFAAGLPGRSPAFHPGCFVRAGMPTAIEFTFRRGFVSEVRCSLADWCGSNSEVVEFDSVVAADGLLYPRLLPRPGIGPQVVRRHPVEVVTITDGLVRVPLFGGVAALTSSPPESPSDGSLWLPPNGQWPAGFNHDRFHRTEEEARKYISDFLIAWAKSQPLTPVPLPA